MIYLMIGRVSDRLVTSRKQARRKAENYKPQQASRGSNKSSKSDQRADVNSCTVTMLQFFLQKVLD